MKDIMNTATETEQNSLNDSIAILADKAAQMTEQEFSLLIRIMDLVQGRPELRQFVHEYTGKMAELPGILESM